MKKINKALLAITPVVTALIPAATLASCGNSNHFEELTLEDKQVVGDEDGYAIYHATLKNKIEDSQKIYIDVERGSKSQDDVNVECYSQTYVNDKDVWFILYLNAPKDIKTYWQEFKITFNCVYGWSGSKVWSQTVSGYKLTFDRIYDSHALSCRSAIFNIKVSLDKTEVGEEDEFNVKVEWDTNRKTDLTNASLTITAGLKSLCIPIAGSITKTQAYTAKFTKKAIQDLFTAAGLGTIYATDPIHFTVAKTGEYTVKSNKLYKIDELGWEQLVDDADIPSRQFLVLNEDREFILHKETEKDKDDAFKNFLSNATEASYNVYFLKGAFFNYNQGTANATNLNIYGITNSKNEKISALRTYGDDQTGTEGNHALNVTFNLHYMNVYGRNGLTAGNFYAEGIICSGFNAEDCDFTGANTLWSKNSVFKNCTFDTTKTYKESGSKYKNNDAMFLYSNASAEFINCTFESIGKAVKIFNTTNEDVSVSFTGCTFNLNEPDIPAIPGFEIAEYECPINIDGSQTGTGKYTYVTIDDKTSCNALWVQKKQGGSAYPICWIKAYQRSGTTFANTIKINSTEVKCDEVPA